MKKYDAIVIGAGSGGYVAAIKLAQLNKKCAIIEKESLGGTCLNWGCIPMKALIKNAEVISSLYEGDKYGFETGDIKIDYSKAYKRSRQVSEKLVGGVKYLLKKNNVDVYMDEAQLGKNKTVLLKNKKETLQAESIIIASGAKPLRLPFADYANDKVLDSKKALQLKKAPKSVCIIGGGAIGLEFASVWNAYGSNVTVVEMMERVLPFEDEDISKQVESAYKKSGIHIITNTKVSKIDTTGSIIKVKAEQKTIECEYVLVSAGIRPDAAAIKGVVLKLDEKGYVKVDENMQTNTAGVYAIGDITGKLALAHTASAQGIVAAQHIAGQMPESIDYNNIPACTYGLIETASTGLTEQEAKQKGIDYITGVFPLSVNGKTLTLGESAGLVKVVADKKYNEILGIHMAGPHVTEIIGEAVCLIGLEATLDELASQVHPHPTVSEAVMEAAHAALGEAIHI